MDLQSDCYIELSKHIFAPGELVTGFLHLILEKPLNIDRVSIRFSGKLETFVHKEKGENFEAKKTFFDRTFEILKFEKSQKNENQKSTREKLNEDEIGWAFVDVEIYSEKKNEFLHGFESGSHKIPISYKLPPDDLVTSFAAKKCPTTVKYTVTGYFHFEEKLVRVAKLEFPVVAPLAVFPGPCFPLEEKITKQLGKNSHGTVDLTLTMNKTSYLPTEKMDCRITIRNNWKHSIKFVHFNILQKMVSTVQNTATVGSKKIISVIEHPGVGFPRNFRKIIAGGNFSFSPEYYIPALIPMKEIPNLFKIEYFAKVQIGRFPNWVLAECCVPIAIGTHYFVQDQIPVMKEEILVDLSTPPQTPTTTFSPNNPFLRELNLTNYGY